MRMRTSSFTRCPDRIDERPAMIEPVIETPITSEFTPGQTLAMLRMRGSELSMMVHNKLRNGTARATLEDYTDLATLGYARRLADQTHRLTPHGHFKANALTKALAVQLGLPTTILPGTTRKTIEPGLKSRSNFW